jgi:hypothetical protein
MKGSTTIALTELDWMPGPDWRTRVYIEGLALIGYKGHIRAFCEGKQADALLQSIKAAYIERGHDFSRLVASAGGGGRVEKANIMLDLDGEWEFTGDGPPRRKRKFWRLSINEAAVLPTAEVTRPGRDRDRGSMLE